ncbi:helix-hairpin-helix domain-containing protein [Actinoplanes italicus]|uniref:helix-hairpin-helix domain-containing protein n=1 Tax=Actinoplanes italicus TaxID=113567 RepID=UPI0035A257A9
MIPAWSAEEDDVSPLGDVARSGPGAPGGGTRRSSDVRAGYPWDTASVSVASPALSSGSPGLSSGSSPGPDLSGEGAFGSSRRQWLQAFDPGRPGVRAMAAVAVVVVLVAAFLAWKSRPRVDPIPAGTVSVAPSSGPGPGPATGAEIVVAVGGKVRKPGLVRLAPGARVADALTAAGGAEPGVDVAMLNLARKVADGELIMVGAAVPSGQVVPGSPGGATGGLVNLNTATLAELDALPGVGPVLAQRILDARDAQGGFRGVSDLRKVDGIGDARYEQLKELVTV